MSSKRLAVYVNSGAILKIQLGVRGYVLVNRLYMVATVVRSCGVLKLCVGPIGVPYLSFSVLIVMFMSLFCIILSPFILLFLFVIVVCEYCFYEFVTAFAVNYVAYAHLG